ncbi:MAG: hypothetical protein R3307_10660 [Anaerolineales bacterium]|nr:hypothetical protein [Anaerolineales bacterium]
MKIFYDASTGEIIRAVYDRDLFSTPQDAGTSVFEIDEIPENILICKEIHDVQGVIDINEQGLFYIDLNTTTLYKREGWEAWLPPFS